MGTITEDVKYLTSYDLAQDVTAAAARIEYSLAMSNRRYIFIGEDHNFFFDVERRNQLARQFSDKEGMLLITERGMRGERDILLTTLIDGKGRIHEDDFASSSADPIRNTKIATSIVQELAGDPPHRKRPVLIFFGQDHEAGLRAELQKQLPVDERICWWSYPSILVQIEGLPDPVYANQAGFTFVGFTQPPPLSDPTLNKLLLTKGLVPTPFTIQVKAGFNSANHLLPKTSIYAVYGANHVPETNNQIAAMDLGSGVCNFTVASPAAVRIVKVDSDVVYQQLKDL